ncbi:MAG: transposase [Thermofilum sp.]|nr:transposase [Thermofilum sp.]
MSRSEGKGNWRGGFRVFKLHADGENTERLRQLFRDFADGRTRVKGALYYRDVWLEEWKNVLKMREEAGKRTMPNPPAALLPARFTMPDGTTRGDKNAPCVIDLRRGELRIPSYGVVVPLRERVCRALVGENGLEPRPDFVLQVTRKGFVRIIARREAYSALGRGGRLRLVCVDENSSYGFVVAVFDYDGKWRLTHFRIYRPPNHGYREGVVSLLQSFADKPSREAREALARIPLAMTPERARELSALAKHRERRENDEFIRRLVGDLRKVVREARERNMHVVVLVDPIDSDTLRGTPLQRTLLRARKHLRNLARYEGAEFRLLRASGKQCPICGSWGVEVAPRTYRCPSCGITWDRDRCAVLRLPLLYLERLEEEREECDDAKYEVGRLATEFRGFLKRHLGFLNPVPQGRGNRNHGPRATGAPARGTEEAVRVKPLPQGRWTSP